MKKNSTRKKSISEKLIGYSALSTAFVVAGASDAEAQIEYTDFDPDLVVENDSLEIDFDGDGLVDIQFGVFADSTAGNRNVRIVSDNATGVRLIGAAGSGAAFFYPFVLGAGEVVGSSANFEENMATYNGGVATCVWEYFGGGSYGYWAGESGYIGLEFISGDDEIHYGWVELEVNNDPADMLMTATFKGYAFNTTPDESIMTGQTATGLDDIINQNTVVFAHDNILNVNVLETDFQANMRVLNTNGQVVLVDAINGANKTFNLSDQATGIYMVELSNESGIATKKIFLSGN